MYKKTLNHLGPNPSFLFLAKKPPIRGCFLEKNLIKTIGC
jgi:hypothetical protein